AFEPLFQRGDSEHAICYCPPQRRLGRCFKRKKDGTTVPDVPILIVIRNYDSITPLIAGDVRADGVDLRLDRATPMAQFTRDPAFQAGEMSFAQCLRRLAEGDDEFIGLPLFVTRGFRQRCFFVQRNSSLTSLDDLAGTRIGIDSWGATGHTWNRALLREAGI